MKSSLLLFWKNERTHERTQRKLQVILKYDKYIIGEFSLLLTYIIVNEGKVMEIKEYCNLIRRQYPEYVSKEQMCIICHLSKRKAQYLLLNGFVPCITNGKLTHNYKIKIEDIIFYLEDREVEPEKYRRRTTKIKTNARRYIEIRNNDSVKDTLYEYYTEYYHDYPDVLTVTNIVEMTKYSRNTVLRWLKNNRLASFKVKNLYRVPKEYLIEFLTCEYFLKLGIKSKKQIIDLEGFRLWYTKKQA